MAAPVLFEIFGFPVSNSMAISWVVAMLIIAFAQYATRQISRVPSGAQNFWEWVIEGLGGVLEGILGRELFVKTFWFFASVFLFILSCNLFALIPGVGTIGWGYGENWWSLHVSHPFLRGANADVKMTMAIALVFFIFWIYWSFQSNGVGGVVHHIFGSKAKMTGALGWFVALIFVFVGLIEVVSIMVRPVSLTFRLYGNIFGGESMIEALMMMFGNWSALVLIPVYLFELLVAFVQSLVFCLLTAVFTALMCKHEEGVEHH